MNHKTPHVLILSICIQWIKSWRGATVLLGGLPFLLVGCGASSPPQQEAVVALKRAEEARTRAEDREWEAVAERRKAEERQRTEAVARQRAEEGRRTEAAARQRAEEGRRTEAVARQRAEEGRRTEATARQRAEEGRRMEAAARQRAEEDCRRARREREEMERKLARTRSGPIPHSHNINRRTQALDENRRTYVGNVTSATQSSERTVPRSITQMELNDATAYIARRTELGQQNVSAHINKDAIFVLGITGSGKSTAINYWFGRDMQYIPDEVDLENIIIVHPDSAQPEATSIGHGRVSHTLMPQMLQDPNRATRIYVDCPGFWDNRGAKVNIANIINIRQALQQVRSVKAIFLMDYSSLHTGRGESVRDLAKMCEQLFGNVDNLRRHQASILWGINRAPAQVKIGAVREWLTGMNSPAVQILGQRVFFYDPLDRGGEDFWSRDRFLAEIDQMPAIPQEVASTMFQTALTVDDKTALQNIVEHQVGMMRNSLAQEDYTAVERGWNLLNQLQIIGHKRIDELVDEQVRPRMQAYAEARMSAFGRHVLVYQFAEAEQILTKLRSLHGHFPDENLVDFESLEASLQTARAQLAAKQEAEEATQRAREATQRAREATQRLKEEAQEAREATWIAEEKTQRIEAERIGLRTARINMEERIEDLEQKLRKIRR